MRGADYVIKRTAFALITIFVAVTLNFVLFRGLARRHDREPVEGARSDPRPS